MDPKENGKAQAFLEAGPYSFGLTKREHFAAMAMQGYRASLHYAEMNAKEIASLARDDADALLRALAAGGEG